MHNPVKFSDIRPSDIQIYANLCKTYACCPEICIGPLNIRRSNIPKLHTIEAYTSTLIFIWCFLGHCQLVHQDESENTLFAIFITDKRRRGEGLGRKVSGVCIFVVEEWVTEPG